MRVLFVNRFFYPDHSATSQMLTDLAHDLRRAGMDITVVTGRQLIDDPRARLPVHEHVDGIDVHRVWSTRFGRATLAGRAIDYLSFYLGAGWRMARLCRAGDVVVAKTDPPLISVVAGTVAKLRGAWQLEHRFAVIYSGNMGYAHEFGTILDAAYGLRERADIVFLFIGGGMQREHIAQEAARRGLTNVWFKPYQPRELLDQSLTAANAQLVSLLPRLEGLMVPSKFYAAAAAGRPILFIGDDDGELARLIVDGDCGFQVRVGAGEALADRVATLAADPALGRRQGAAALMAYWGGVVLEDLGFLGSGGSVFLLSGWEIVFTVFATVGVINALNMSDGADGLAGGLALIALLGLAYVAGSGGFATERTLLTMLAVVVAGFLLFNMRLPWRHRARVFMGDAGSMFLGFAITWFFIAMSQGEDRAMAPVAALWLLMIPLFDTIWLILWRFSQGRSPTSSDVGHLHHVLQMTGMRTATSV